MDEPGKDAMDPQEGLVVAKSLFFFFFFLRQGKGVPFVDP